VRENNRRRIKKNSSVKTIEDQLKKFDNVDEGLLQLGNEFYKHKMECIKTHSWEEAAMWRDKER